MKNFIIIFAIILFSSVVFSQQAFTDAIYLKNADIVNSSIITLKYIDILKFTKEKTSQNLTIKPNKSTEIDEPFNSPDKPQVKSSEYNYTRQYSSIALGYGNSYGGLGVKFEQRLGAVAIHGGIGYFPPPANYAKGSALFSGGIKFFFSNSDMYLDLQFGTFGVAATELTYVTDFFSSTVVTQKALYGPSVLLGNTLWFSSTVGLNGAIGASYNMEKINWSDKYTVLLALDLGLTIKF